MFSPGSDGGVAFFAYVDGFVFGFLLALFLSGGSRITTPTDADSRNTA